MCMTGKIRVRSKNETIKILETNPVEAPRQSAAPKKEFTGPMASIFNGVLMVNLDQNETK